MDDPVMELAKKPREPSELSDNARDDECATCGQESSTLDTGPSQENLRLRRGSLVEPKGKM